MQAYEDDILAYKGTGRRYDTLRLCFETIYNDDIDSLTSDPAAMRRHHPRHADRVPKPDPTVRSVGPTAEIIEILGLSSSTVQSWTENTDKHE